jgi:two-component system, sensor histidine kinase ChiS
MPVIARLSFWAPSERMDEFAETHEKELVPILKEHGLEDGFQPDRASVAGVFSQLFELESPQVMIDREKALYRDPLWNQALQELGTVFGTTFAATEPEGAERYYDGHFSKGMIVKMASLLRYYLGHYVVTAGEGRTGEAGPGIHRGAWHNFSVEDGLLDSIILGITEDEKGNIWFASNGAGVSRYDGGEFTTFTEEDGLAGNCVRVILKDREGNLWFSTNRGFCRFDGREFSTFTTEDGLADNNVSEMLQDRQGNIWFGTFGGGVGCYDGREFVTYTTEDGLAENNIRSIGEDREGNLWFGTKEQGVCRYDGREFANFSAEDGLADNRVQAILQDRDGHLWFGCGRWERGNSGGITRYDGYDFETYRIEDGVSFDAVWSILQDRENQLWFCRYGNGVTRYNGQFETFNTEEGLAHNRVTCAIEDRAGRIWFGTWGGGVSCYTEKAFYNFSLRDGLFEDGISRVHEDAQGIFWLSTWRGIYRYESERMTPVDHLRGRAWVIVEDQMGRLWFGTNRGGISCFDGQEFKVFTSTDGLVPGIIGYGLEDQRGNLWFGSLDGGVARYDGHEFANFTAVDGLGEGMILTGLEDRHGFLWFGTSDGGASRFDGREFRNFTVEDGLCSNRVDSICEDRQGCLWFASDRGVSHFDGKCFDTLTMQDGLVYDRINHVTEDENGHLWFATRGGGISRYDGLVFQQLTQRDGLLSNEVLHISRDSRGYFWIGTSGGLTRYYPQDIPPSLRITEVIADRNYGPVAELRMSSSQKYLVFEFLGISWTTRVEGMAYVYRLRGYDDEWRSSYTRRVEYKELPVGGYAFQVRAVDRDLNYSESVTVRVEVVSDERDRQIDELEHRVQERTLALAEANELLSRKNREIEQANLAKSSFLTNMSHELRTPMNVILGFTELLQGNREENLNSRQLRNLNTIHRNASDLLILINQLLDLSKIEAERMEVTTETFQIAELVLECLGMAESLIGEKSIELRCRSANDFPVVRMDRSKIRQILVNLLSNAVKSTEKGWIQVRMWREGGDVCFAVEDTGLGIPKEKLESIFEKFGQVSQDDPGTGLGLAISDQLCYLLGGAIEVKSTLGKGSTFTVRLPLEYAPGDEDRGDQSPVAGR